jgi:dihydroorotate dehydrogenase electron transfer subunit
VRSGEAICGRLRGLLVSREPVGTYWRLRFRVPGWKAGEPGQFAMVQPAHSSTFLARAFSLHEQSGEDVTLLVAPVGEATEELCRLRPGDAAWVLGPLGRAFELEGHQGRVLLVGGGVGVAPFPLLLDRLWAHPGPEDQTPGAGTPGPGRSAEVHILLGFKETRQAEAASVLRRGVTALKEAGWRVAVEVVTEDGALGPAALVTEPLSATLREGDLVLVCGPAAMCAAVWRECLAVERVEAWFSLEAGMACGVGSCHGCAVLLADGTLARLCRRGAVMRGEEIYGAGALGGPA